MTARKPVEWCPGSRTPPARVTLPRGDRFSGYGVCPVCEHEAALSVIAKTGQVVTMHHRDRRPVQGCEQLDPSSRPDLRGIPFV